MWWRNNNLVCWSCQYIETRMWKPVVDILCSIDSKENLVKHVHYTVPSPVSGLCALWPRWRSWEDGHTQWYPVHQMSAKVSTSTHRSGKLIMDFYIIDWCFNIVNVEMYTHVKVPVCMIVFLLYNFMNCLSSI